MRLVAALSSVVAALVVLQNPVAVTNFPATQPISGSVSVSNFPATQPVSGSVTANAGTGPASAWKVDGSGVTQPVSGTFWQATQPISGTVTAQQVTASSLQATVTQQTLTKGTQGSVGVSTQDLKDAGRDRVSFTADRVTPAASDTLVTFTKNVGGTATTAQTTYTVTSGKTLRIETVTIGVATSTTAAFSVRVALRENTSGSCTASSAPVTLLEAATLTAVTNEGANFATAVIPDGWEFPAADSVCVSAIASSATGTLTVTVLGFEY